MSRHLNPNMRRESRKDACGWIRQMQEEELELEQQRTYVEQYAQFALTQSLDAPSSPFSMAGRGRRGERVRMHYGGK